MVVSADGLRFPFSTNNMTIDALCHYHTHGYRHLRHNPQFTVAAACPELESANGFDNCLCSKRVCFGTSSPEGHTICSNRHPGYENFVES